MQRAWVAVCWVVLMGAVVAPFGKGFAQYPADSLYQSTAVDPVRLDANLYDSLRQADDYSVDFQEEKKKEEKKQDKPLDARDIPDFDWAENVVQILLFVLAFLILVALIYALSKEGVFNRPKNQQVEGQVGGYSLEEIEEQFQELDLEGLIKKAVDNGQLNIAVRLYYLEVLKQLANGGFIKWRKNKTSREYQSELRGTVLATDFAALTNAFNRVWYGDTELERYHFDALAIRFRSYLTAITQLKTTPNDAT